MKSRIIFLAAIVIMSQSVFADSGDSTRTAPLHLSFITPLGTNGMESWNTTNNLSVNMFAGFSGGLNGIEFAGFANALKGDMKGVQLAGFCNNTFGVAEGAEIAGFWNYNQKWVKGFQAAGFANAAIGYVDGFQASGFANYADGVSFGQFSGFANLSTDKTSGMQASGFSNVAVGDMKGVQGAGFANLTVGDHFGVQAAGFTNVTTGRTKGIQASGFLNYTKKLSGVQVGVFNYADSVENGMPIGFLSFVKNGYLDLEIGGNESLFGTISVKTGVKRFYNILSVGGSLRGDRLLWGWGYGIGSQLAVAKRMDISLEAISYHLNEDAWFSGDINLLNRASATLSYNLNSRFSVYAGPALNVWLSNVDKDGVPYTEAPLDAWAMYKKARNRTEVTIYPGLSAGIRIKMN